MAGAIAPKDWLRSAIDATAEVATGTLGYAANDQVEYSEEIPSGHRGAFIGLISQHNSVQLGVMSANGGCEKLARDLLGFEADEDVAHEDVADAVGEIINIVAGMVKKKLEDQDSNLKLGLPMFIEGRVAPMEQQGATVARLDLDGVGTQVVVVYEGRK